MHSSSKENMPFSDEEESTWRDPLKSQQYIIVKVATHIKKQAWAMEFFAQFAFTTYIFDEVFAKMTESTQSAQKLRLTDTLFIFIT